MHALVRGREDVRCGQHGLTVAAAEAVVGLAILVDIFRTRDAEDVDDLSELRG